MAILNKKYNQLINLFKYFLSKFLEKLVTGILSIRKNTIMLIKKIGIFKGLNLHKVFKLKEILIKNLKIVSIILFTIIITICFFAFNKNYYHTLLFYPDKNKNLLLTEKREIIKDNDKTKRIKKIVEELLLGPIDPEMYNVFPKESKLLSIRLEDNILFLNLNKETVMNIENVSGDNKLIYSLLLKSIVNSVCFQEKDINLIKFYFNGKEYKYLGTYGPIIEGIKPDWNILK